MTNLRMHKRAVTIGAIFAAVVTFTGRAHAETTPAEYKASMNDPAKRSQMIAYIAGLGMAYGWASAFVQANGGSPLFCPPEQLVLTRANYISLLEKHIEEQAKIGQSDIIEPQLLEALEETFPCK
jgi:hypothetical protein